MPPAATTGRDVFACCRDGGLPRAAHGAGVIVWRRVDGNPEGWHSMRCGPPAVMSARPRAAPRSRRRLSMGLRRQHVRPLPQELQQLRRSVHAVPAAGGRHGVRLRHQLLQAGVGVHLIGGQDVDSPANVAVATLK